MSISFKDKVQRMWDYVGEHSDRLFCPEQVGLQKSKPELYQEFYDLLQDIHPEMEVQLLSLPGDSSRIVLYFPLRGKTYLYYIFGFIRALMPARYKEFVQSTYGDSTALLDDGHRRIELIPRYKEELYATISEGEQSILSLYSESIDLYNPEEYELCLQHLEMLFGEALFVFYIDAIHVAKCKPDGAVPVKELLRLHNDILGESECFPPIPYQPLALSLNYAVTNLKNTNRSIGRVSDRYLAEEMGVHYDESMWQSVERPTLTMLEGMGIKAYSLHFHYVTGGRIAYPSVREFIIPLMQDEDFDRDMTIIGNGKGGEDEEHYFLDVLMIDPERNLPKLYQQAKLSDCSIYLIEHSHQPTQRLRILADIESLGYKELHKRGASPQLIVDKIEALRGERTTEQQLILGESYLFLDRYEEAINALSIALRGKPKNANILMSLAMAHMGRISLYDSLAERKPYIAEAYNILQQCLDHRSIATRARLMLATICFTMPMGDEEAAFEEGNRYLAEARKHKSVFARFASHYIDPKQALAERYVKDLEVIYNGEFGVPTAVKPLRLSNGHQIDMLFYEDSVHTKNCNVLISRGFHALPMVESITGDKDKPLVFNRFEFVFALPKTLRKEDFLAGVCGWAEDFMREQVMAFVDMDNRRISPTYFDRTITQLCIPHEHPYGQHASYRMMLKPIKIFKDAMAMRSIHFSSKEKLHFVGVTPMYDEEYEYSDIHTPEECRQQGFWKLSPIYEKGRPSLCPQLMVEEVDWDHLQGNLPRLQAES